MERILGRFSSYIYSLLRIIAGLMFACHGSQKIFGFPGTNPPLPHIVSLPLASGIRELVCGLLIAIGLLTSIAAFIASGEMAVAYFLVHAKSSLWPILNHGELAVLYCFLFLYIAASGPGIWSVDSGRRGSRRRV
jgi:putative oxidoreductase